jgi:hypothetical protein
MKIRDMSKKPLPSTSGHSLSTSRYLALTILIPVLSASTLFDCRSGYSGQGNDENGQAVYRGNRGRLCKRPLSLKKRHLPLLNAFQRNIGPKLTSMPHLLAYSLYWVWVAAIVFPFSFAVYQLIEKPGMRLSNRLQKRQPS